MQTDTIDQINQAAGRALSRAELDGIEARVGAAMHDLEAQDPAGWRAKSIDERAAAAGKLAQSRHVCAVLTAQSRAVQAMTEQAKRQR